jgi:hypothetical protein
MLSHLATSTEMEAARLLMGTTMVGFLAASFFRGRGQTIRMIVTALYITAVLGFVFYYTL